MYEDAQHRRLTEYISAEPGADLAVPRCRVDEPLSVCAWSNGALTFVLVGAATPDALRALAEQVRAQAARTAP
jgi:hypothetical protein